MDLISQLNNELGISDQLLFSEGRNRLPRAILKNDFGSAELYLLGAHVTDWSDKNNTPLLFLSSKAEFGAGKAIRGGIPIVFPQFGVGPLPPHGFARTSTWDLVSTSSSSDNVEIVLRLLPSPATRAIWPHEFELYYTVQLGESLTTMLEVKNIGSGSLQFNAALHTYFAVADIESVSVYGLAGLNYLDSLKNRAMGLERAEELLFPDQVDRIYLESPNTLRIVDPGNRRQFVIDKSNFSDAVTWNPGAERAKAISDLEDQDYRRFVCVEPAAASAPLTLAAGESIKLSQQLSVMPLTI